MPLRTSCIPPHKRTLRTPAPSAVYELLRFGRVINTAHETLTPNDVPHWRKVKVSATQEGWVNLNATNVHKFSDADFPPWQGWQLIVDDDDNSRCDAQDIIKLITDTDKSGKLSKGEAQTALQDQGSAMTVQQAQQLAAAAKVQKKLRKTVCKFVSEWSKADIDKQWGWLKDKAQADPSIYLSPTEDKANHVSDDYTPFKKHVEALAIDFNKLGIPAKHWHFHPREFIKQFRKCGWLSEDEVLRLIPVNVIRKPGSHNSNRQAVWESPDIATSRRFLNLHLVNLNKALRKFVISTSIRQACFFGNSTQETQWFGDLREGHGRDPNLHLGWYGRGFLQLTNPNGDLNGGNNNYYKYFKFLGRTPQVPATQQELAWRDEIGTDSYHAAHSAAAYWVWPDKASPSTRHPNTPQVDNTNRYADDLAANQRRTIATQAGTKIWYYNQSFTNCAAAVNYPATTGQNPPNMNGLVDRSTSFINALMVLTDTPRFPDVAGRDRDIPENFTNRIVP